MSAAWDGDLNEATVDEAVFTLRPDYVAVLIIGRGLTPGESSPASEEALRDAEVAAMRLLDGREPHDLEALQEWRAAFACFGVKPREARSSAEALMRRIAAGLPRIDHLTDVYNAVSVMHQIPIGGEALAGYVGPPRLTIATGDETFDTIADGQPVVSHPTPGEVIWRDEVGVTCRRWNWRQCVRTRLTTTTTDALFILDGLGQDARARGERAARDLMARLRGDSPHASFEMRVIASTIDRKSA